METIDLDFFDPDFNKDEISNDEFSQDISATSQVNSFNNHIIPNSDSESLKKPSSSESSLNREILPVYKRYSKFGVLLWFLKRNFFNLLSRFLVFVFFVWLLLCGGLVSCLNFINDFVSRISSTDSASVTNKENSSISSDNNNTIPSEIPSDSPSDENFSSDVENHQKQHNQETKLPNLVLITPECAFFSNSDILKVGDIINENSPFFQGQKNVFVKSLNFKNCSILLSDGRVIRLQSSSN